MEIDCLNRQQASFFPEILVLDSSYDVLYLPKDPAH